jgi:hypothetical protein
MPATAAGDDPPLEHFLRFACVYAAVLASIAFFLVGFVWLAAIMNRTGRRRRDVLLAPVPVIGAIVNVSSVWRYTARHVYWSARPDRPSSVLSGPARPIVIAFGALVGVSYVGLGVLGAALAPMEWSDDYRRGFITELRRAGYTATEADCVASAIEDAYEGEEPDGDEGDFQRIVDAASEVCGVTER